MKIDIDSIGYRWKGVYSPNIAYKERDVVFKDGGAHVIRNGTPQAFALGQQDAILKGHLLTGGVSVGGVGSMMLHSNSNDSIEFRFTDDRNGTTVARLMETVQNHRTPYASNRYGMFVMTDGSVRCIGRSNNGQLGDGGNSDTSRMIAGRAAFPKGVKIARVEVAWTNTYYIDTDGGLWMSGANDGNYMSGRGLSGVIRTPLLLNGNSGIPANAKIVDLMTTYGYYGYSNTMALDNQGRVYAWGYNQSGCLGLNTTSSISTATLVPFTASVPIKSIAVNGNYYGGSCLIDYAGNAWVAGNESLCFAPANANHSVHQRLDLGGRAVKKMFWDENDQHWVAGSQYDWSVGILFENGEVYLRGTAPVQVGMDGNGWTMSGNNSAFTMPFHTGVKDIWVAGGGYQHAIALMNDGTIQAKGYSGYGINANASNTTTWTTIGGSFLTNVTKLVMMGGQYGSTAAALRADGQLVVWGGNLQGCKGDGSAWADAGYFPDAFFRHDRPIVDFCFGGMRYEATGVNCVYALDDLGRVVCSGAGDYGMNGDDDTENTATPQFIRF